MLIKSIILSLSLFSGLASAEEFSDYQGSSFEEVWSEVTSSEYALPNYKVSFGSLFKGGVDLITRAANRTLFVKSDLLEKINDDHYPNKLAHPNGICLSGTWQITEDNPYSGYFKKGSKALIIVRASTAMTSTTVGDDRSFGMAGKIFPTNDPSEITKTANFFTIDDLGGTDAEHFTDVSLTNAPKISAPDFWLLRYALKLKDVFGDADQNPAERQVYEISELKEDNIAEVITPKDFMITAKDGQTVDFRDFRDELNVENYNKNLVFEISVGDRSSKQATWMKIGEITLRESIVSASCDRHLHFHHPKWKVDLNH